MFTIRSAHAIRGIRTHIISSSICQSGQVTRETSDTNTVNSETVIHGRVWQSIPTHATGGNNCTSCVCHVAAAKSRGTHYIAHRIRSHRRDSCFHITEAADRESAGLVVVVPDHGRVAVVQGAVPGAVAVELRRGPEVGVAAHAVERRTAADACRNGGKTCGIVRALVITHRTAVRGCVPPFRGSQRLGDVAAVAAASIFALAAHIVRQLSPLRIARQVPARRTDASAVAAECHRHGIVGAGIHTRLPVCRVERIHRRIPIVEQAVVHRRVGSRVVVVPAGLLARVCRAGACRWDKVRSCAR